MNEKSLEHVSSLLDDELAPEDSEQTIEILCDSRQTEIKLDRYALIGDALRDETIIVYDEGFLAKVKKAIEEEPIMIAPAHIKKSNNRPYIGVAIAASFAFISVILFNVFPGSSNTDEMSPYAEVSQSDDSHIAFEDEPKNAELERYLNAQRDADTEQNKQLDTQLVGFKK